MFINGIAEVDEEVAERLRNHPVYGQSLEKETVPQEKSALEDDD